VFNTVISKMVTAVLWTSPLGIASLIAAAVCRACSLLGTLRALSLWLATVLTGLALFGALLLPLAFWAAIRRRPLDVARGFSRALVLAFGTSSSSAALPVRPPPSLRGGHWLSPGQIRVDGLLFLVFVCGNGS
jgi:solute carrier family 1 (high affinity glutamate transporter) protein 2